MHAFQDPVGPFGESRASDSYRAGVQEAARDALSAIAAHRRGEVDGLLTCRAIVNDPYLREIVPIELLLGFIGAESNFDLDLDPKRAHLLEPSYWAELCERRDAYFASEGGSIVTDCDALFAHLVQWQRENPPRPAED